VTTACPGYNHPGVAGTVEHTATAGHNDWFGYSDRHDDGEMTCYMWTYSNGYNPSGDWFKWYAYPGPWATCRIYVEIPYNLPEDNTPFNSGATYTVYTNSSGTELGSTFANQQANSGNELGTMVDLGSWQASGSGNLSVYLDDSDFNGGSYPEHTVAAGMQFDCT
jgi:hypothetical protein